MDMGQHPYMKGRPKGHQISALTIDPGWLPSSATEITSAAAEVFEVIFERYHIYQKKKKKGAAVTRLTSELKATFIIGFHLIYSPHLSPCQTPVETRFTFSSPAATVGGGGACFCEL